MIKDFDYVVCKICNKKMKQITYKHLKHHNITVEEYKDKFPNELIRCTKSKNIHIKHQNETNNKRYNCDRPLQNKDIKNKADKTLLTNHGVKNAFNIDGANEKSKQTQLLKYGAETPFNKESKLREKIDKSAQTIEAKNKRVDSFRKTCLKKYGVDHNWKIKSIRIKCVNTLEKRYGYRSVFSNEDIIKKALNKCLSKQPNKPETIILNIVGNKGWYSGNGSYWIRFKNGKNKNPDIKIHGVNKVIEHYGSYWHRNDSSDEIIKLYKEVGYDCLVIWEYELDDIESVKLKIESFINN